MAFVLNMDLLVNGVDLTRRKITFIATLYNIRVALSQGASIGVSVGCHVCMYYVTREQK
jgi:hypothetical protein